jgi:hypothetical protein
VAAVPASGRATPADAGRGTVRVEALPAVPSELARETDPVRRAELEKQHRLATARVRLSLLQRRERMLRESISRARDDGSWSADKLREAQRDLEELGVAIKAAEKRLAELGDNR